MSRHIEVPALEQGQCIFDVETMELPAPARLEILCADLNKVVHDYSYYR